MNGKLRGGIWSVYRQPPAAMGQHLRAALAKNLVIVGMASGTNGPGATVSIEGEESALFGEATWHFTDQWKATVGGRYFETQLSTNIAQSGPLIGGSTQSEGRSREQGFSPKASLTWSPDDDLLVYGLVSKGFRFGGPNLAVDPDFAIPAEFESDSLINYELGVRSNFDRRRPFDDCPAAS